MLKWFCGPSSNIVKLVVNVVSMNSCSQLINSIQDANIKIWNISWPN